MQALTMLQSEMDQLYPTVQVLPIVGWRYLCERRTRTVHITRPQTTARSEHTPHQDLFETVREGAIDVHGQEFIPREKFVEFATVCAHIAGCIHTDNGGIARTTLLLVLHHTPEIPGGNRRRIGGKCVFRSLRVSEIRSPS